MVSLQKAVSVTIMRARRSLRPSDGPSNMTRDEDDDDDDDDNVNADDGASRETLIFLAGSSRACESWLTCTQSVTCDVRHMTCNEWHGMNDVRRS